MRQCPEGDSTRSSCGIWVDYRHQQRVLRWTQQQRLLFYVGFSSSTSSLHFIASLLTTLPRKGSFLENVSCFLSCTTSPQALSTSRSVDNLVYYYYWSLCYYKKGIWEVESWNDTPPSQVV
ncbi:hypothetical protein PIB30_045401 [Stylosanthes scabra]|uniref:Uncharacterized protein n=1 Tax=Stylosanthes scabra TaxID=79078 RepID=A0ABU6WG17_9FABA|nr:hypothetical protein [Stylosanthes scabra]